ncbi:MAG: SCO family protein [Kiloniellales bacterium]
MDRLLPQSTVARLGVALALVAGLGMAGLLLWQTRHLGGSAESLAVSTGGAVQIGGPFTLVDQDGKTVTQADFAGRYMLIYFGYTYCPDVCPTELAAMSQALDILEERDPTAAAQVTPIFITVDPQRDTVAAMADYATHFHPRLRALTGSPQQVAEAARAYRVYYQKTRDPDASDYLMDHSSFIYLMGPEGDYVSHFTFGTEPEKMAEALQRRISGS